MRAIELGLLAVSVLVFFVLIVTAPARRRIKSDAEAAQIADDAARREDANNER